MRILGPEFVAAHAGRILNIHPAFCPVFPGVHGQPDAARHGVKLSGCTVHFVDEKMDHGPIVIQAAVPALAADDGKTLGARILALSTASTPGRAVAVRGPAAHPGPPRAPGPGGHPFGRHVRGRPLPGQPAPGTGVLTTAKRPGGKPFEKGFPPGPPFENFGALRVRARERSFPSSPGLPGVRSGRPPARRAGGRPERTPGSQGVRGK
jgi:hypothetical protein